MLADAPQAIQVGRLAPDIHLPGSARLALLDFIAAELPRWRDHPDRPAKTAETALTEHLCDHLNSASHGSEAWSHVQFRTETGDETAAGRKIDLSVKPRAANIIIEGRRHSQFQALLPIECKRLPTPSDRDRDEREYVAVAKGTTGGIQRFKFGHHGAAHSFAAIIGFVQEQSFDEWLEKINEWIRNLASTSGLPWSARDVLQRASADDVVCTLDSKHERSSGLAECHLRHLWVAMN
jgi:hypothetical protein